MPWRPRHRKRPRSKALAVHGAINNSDGRFQPVGRGDEWADFDTSARHQASAAPGAFRPPQRLGCLDRVTAIFQPLRDEGAAFAERLRSLGVPVDYRLEPEMTHGCLNLFNNALYPEASRRRGGERVELVVTPPKGLLAL